MTFPAFCCRLVGAIKEHVNSTSQKRCFFRTNNAKKTAMNGNPGLVRNIYVKNKQNIKTHRCFTEEDPGRYATRFTRLSPTLLQLF